jgi:hypothetical protein
VRSGKKNCTGQSTNIIPPELLPLPSRTWRPRPGCLAAWDRHRATGAASSAVGRSSGSNRSEPVWKVESAAPDAAALAWYWAIDRLRSSSICAGNRSIFDCRPLPRRWRGRSLLRATASRECEASSKSLHQTSPCGCEIFAVPSAPYHRSGHRCPPPLPPERVYSECHYVLVGA